jgi:glycerol-1-phosphate dehydrogenase [NAD(P)+]
MSRTDDLTDRIPLLEAMLAGTFADPATGQVQPALPFADIRLMETTDGAEADLVGRHRLGGRLAVVSDTNTHDALGGRVARALAAIATVDDVVIDVDEATIEAVRMVQERTRHADAVVAVGSGTLQDLVKYATFLDGRRFVTFATAASMNGYTSMTASITEAGLKLSLPAHTPVALFMDIAVAAAAPPFLARAGLGDSLCRSVAQVDWRMAAALVGTPYHELPFTIQVADEAELLARAGGIATGDPAAIRALYRVLTYVGAGTCFTGTSHHGSMSEHMISHWIDMFAGEAHPGTLHGHQVGYAAVSMSRLQHQILDAPEPPRLSPPRLDETDLRARYGAMADLVLKELSGKTMDRVAIDDLTRRMEDWEAFRRPLRAVMVPTATLVDALDACGGYVTAASSGLPDSVYREALVRAREIRNRFSILDIAAAEGSLEPFAAADVARSHTVA